MSIVTMSMLFFCYLAMFKSFKIPSEVTTIYTMILGSYAASKTITSFSPNQTETTKL